MQQIQYSTRTAYGLSSQTFGGIQNGYTQNPQGAGQGNGAAPQLWAIISSKMFQMLHKLGLANTITSPITNDDLTLVGFAYVDDSDIFSYSNSHNVAHTISPFVTYICGYNPEILST